MQFQISSSEKAGKDIPELSRLEFLEKFLATILLYQMQKITPAGH